MFKSKYTFTFALITFLLLSLSGAGIFVDDEWVSAQQLRQIGEGHQIIYNEGNYGYYANGTSGSYFNYRDNRLMYTIALPLISLPIYEIIYTVGDYFRFFIVALWTLLGFLILNYLHSISKLTKKYTMFGIGSLLILSALNIILYIPFPINGVFLPSEVLAIVTTNIILFGIFSVVLHKTIDLLFDDSKIKLFAFITTLSCTSLIFWVGTCKDHILSVLVATLVLYYLIKYEKNKSMTALTIGLFLIGILTWIRIELGVGMIIGIGLYLLLFHYRDMISNILMIIGSLLVGTIPMWINNYITTGSPIIHPFIIANAGFGSMAASDELAANTLGYGWSHPIGSIFHLLFSPSSGAIGLLIIIPLIIIIIPAYILKKIDLSRTDILLLIIAFCSSLYYIGKSMLYMPADVGIMPDMRYFIFFYTVITLFVISLLSKIIPDLKYKKMLLYYVLSVGLLVILFTAYAATMSKDGTYRDLNRIINTLSSLCMGLGLIAVINDIRLSKNYLTYILPIMIAIPMAWQLVMLFIYHTSKVQSYPMFLPITEFIYNYLFGAII
jgi:hypothetical protein